MECRFCLVTDEAEDHIAPCLCSGTGKWVHRHCLDRYRCESEDAFNQCPTCKAKYQFDHHPMEYSCALRIQLTLILLWMIAIFINICILIAYIIYLVQPELEWTECVLDALAIILFVVGAIVVIREGRAQCPANQAEAGAMVFVLLLFGAIVLVRGTYRMMKEIWLGVAQRRERSFRVLEYVVKDLSNKEEHKL
jgi:hypothetical protein